MSIKYKLIMSYLLVTLFIIILSATFIISSNKINYFITHDMMDKLADREIANSVNSEFKNIVILLKSAMGSNDRSQIKGFEEETNQSLDIIFKSLERKPDDPELKKIASISQVLHEKSDKFFDSRAEYITTHNEMALLFDDMDSLFRKQKGLIFVSKNTLEKFGSRYQNTMNYIDRMMEDPLEIKVYIAETVNAQDEIDVEDGIFTLVNYANKLLEKTHTLLDGGDYKGENIYRMNNEQVRERLTTLLEVTEEMIASSGKLQEVRLKTLEMEIDLSSQISELETMVQETGAELKKLTKTAKANMDSGIVDVVSLTKKLLTTTFIMLAVVLVLAITIGLYSASRITRPLTKIMDVAESIKDGNLNCGKIEHDSQDEFGALTNSINKMNRSLCELVSNIKNSTDYLSNTSDQAADLMHKMHDNLNNTNLEMAAAASAAEELSSSTINIINSVEAGIKEVHTAREKVIEGNSGLQSSISQVGSVAKNLGGVAESLSELKNASQEITTIVGIIVDIAEQTNLLALNAAIEAARAGEAGRGFAVVADEVRKLAEKTGTSTQEISSMVGSIQKNVENVVEIVHNGIEEVESSSKSITEVGEQFEEVVNQMESAANSVEPILGIIEQQSEAISNISLTVTNVSNASEESKEIVDEVSAFSEKLAELSHELQEKISHFKS